MQFMRVKEINDSQCVLQLWCDESRELPGRAVEQRVPLHA